MLTDHDFDNLDLSFSGIEVVSETTEEESAAAEGQKPELTQGVTVAYTTPQAKVSLSACLSAHFYACLLSYLLVCLLACQPACLPFCQAIWLFVHFSTFVSIYP